MRPRHLAAVLCVLALPDVTRAQEPKYAPLVQQMTQGARSTGLGTPEVAMRDIETIFANPALAGVVTGSSISYGRFDGAGSLGTVASSISQGSFGAAFGAQFLNFRTLSTLLPLSSSTITDKVGIPGSSLSALFGLSTPFKGFRVGAAIKFAQEHLGGVRASGPALDLGLSTNRGSLLFGLAVQNIGPALDVVSSKANQPLRTTLGVSGIGGPVGPFDLSVTGAVSVLRDGFVSPAAGVEWGYSWLEGYDVVIRAGVRRPELHADEPVTAGASFTLDRFTLDYALETMRGGAVGHRIGLRVR